MDIESINKNLGQKKWKSHSFPLLEPLFFLFVPSRSRRSRLSTTSNPLWLLATFLLYPSLPCYIPSSSHTSLTHRWHTDFHFIFPLIWCCQGYIFPSSPSLLCIFAIPLQFLQISAIPLQFFSDSKYKCFLLPFSLSLWN